MQRSYILSNKENECAPLKSPIKLKINYQLKQKYPQHSKSPLRLESFNRRTCLNTISSNTASPFSIKAIETNKFCAEEQKVQPFSRYQYENQQGLNNSIQTHSDLSKIRPISMKNSQKQQQSNKILKQIESSNNMSKKNLNEDSLFKFKHRQNSKNMGFSAKVGNLQKMNHQISSLLSYVYENKTASKDTKKDDQNSSYKPSYAMVSQNKNLYQRKISQLQRPKQPEPLVSIFDVEDKQNRQKSQKKDRKNFYKYEYLNEVEKNRSPYKMLELNTQKDMQRSGLGKGISPVTKGICPKHSENSCYNFKQNISNPLRSNKLKQKQSGLVPCESKQKMSNITNNNSDLQFYYQSLKQREDEIQNFKHKLLADQPKTNQLQEQTLSQKYNASFKRQNRLRNFQGITQKKQLQASQFHDHSRQQAKCYEKTPKKDLFITKEEIQIYKDISKLNQVQNKQKTLSQNRLEKISQKRANLQAQIKQELNFVKTHASKTSLTQVQKQPWKQKNDQAFGTNSYQISHVGEKRNSRAESSMTEKIQEKIQKIKNELKDCKKEKIYLREKYGSILGNQSRTSQLKTQNFEQIDNFSRSTRKQIHKEQSGEYYQQHNQMKSVDDQRMFDSDNKRNRHQLNHQIQRNQNFHKKVRDVIVSLEPKTEKEYILKRKARQIQQIDLQGQMRHFHKEPYCDPKELFQNSNDQDIKSNQFQRGVISLRQDSGYEHIDQTAYRQQKSASKIAKGKNSSKEFIIQLNKIQITKPQTTKLASLLTEKIEIDLKLRTQRQKFVKSKNPNKWNQLRSYLQNRYQIDNPLEQLQKLVAISPEEHNPFSPTCLSSSKSPKQNSFICSQSASTQQIPLLCSLLSESIQFFKTRLLKKFSSKQLQKEHFSFKELDLNSKGYLSLQDLVCFVNLHSGKFYRNRDIIFFIKGLALVQQLHQIAKATQIQFQSSIKAVNQYRMSYQFMWNILTDSN